MKRKHSETHPNVEDTVARDSALPQLLVPGEDGQYRRLDFGEDWPDAPGYILVGVEGMMDAIRKQKKTECGERTPDKSL